MNSNQTRDYDMEESPEEASSYEYVAFWINGVISLTLVIIGTLGNAAVVSSLHWCGNSKKPRRRRQAFYFYLMTFAFWNTGLLIATVLFNCVPVLTRLDPNFRTMADISFLIGYPLGNCCLTANIWLAVVVTIERYLAVSLPFHSTRLTSPRRRAKTISIILSIGAILYNLPLLFELSLNQRTIEDPVEMPASHLDHPDFPGSEGNRSNYHLTTDYQFETMTQGTFISNKTDQLLMGTSGTSIKDKGALMAEIDGKTNQETPKRPGTARGQEIDSLRSLRKSRLARSIVTSADSDRRSAMKSADNRRSAVKSADNRRIIRSTNTNAGGDRKIRSIIAGIDRTDNEPSIQTKITNNSDALLHFLSSTNVSTPSSTSDPNTEIPPVYEVRMSSMRDNVYYQFIYRVLGNMIFVSGLPFLVVLLLTIKIVCLVRESDRQRQRFRLDPPKSNLIGNDRCGRHAPATRSASTGSGTSTSQSWRHAHVVLTLIAAKFLLCYSLPVAINILELTSDRSKYESEDSMWSRTLIILVDLSNLLIVIDGATNAFFYFSWWRSRIRLRDRFLTRKRTHDNLSLLVQDSNDAGSIAALRRQQGTGGRAGQQTAVSIKVKNLQHPLLSRAYRETRGGTYTPSSQSSML